MKNKEQLPSSISSTTLDTRLCISQQGMYIVWRSSIVLCQSVFCMSTHFEQTHALSLTPLMGQDGRAKCGGRAGVPGSRYQIEVQIRAGKGDIRSWESFVALRVPLYLFAGRERRIHTDTNDDTTRTEVHKHTHTSTRARTHTHTYRRVRANQHLRAHSSTHAHTNRHAHTHTQDAIDIAQTHGHADLGDTFQDMMRHTQMIYADQTCIPTRALRDMKRDPCTHSGVPTRDTSRTRVRGQGKGT